MGATVSSPLYRHVLGVDLSSTRTGICAGGEVHSFTPTGSLLERARQTSHEVAGWAMSADLIVIEAIGTRQVQTAIALAYVHALVEDRCAGTIVKVAPADLKKFAVGKGNADKDTVMLAAARHEPAISNNDEADAWWLWAIGEWLAGRPFLETDYRHKVIDKIRTKEAR
jgi:Holliday junction resolvasome RuvABC endonuclease subunit